MNKSDLVKIHKLESALIYFMTTLRGNNNIIDSLTCSNFLSNYPKELFDEIIIKNHKQVMKVTQINREIIDCACKGFKN